MSRPLERQRRLSSDREDVISRDGLGNRRIFGSFLRSVRANLGISQQAWANRAGTNDSAWSRMESGSQDIPSRGSLEKICGAAELDPINSRRLMVSAGYLPSLPWEASQEDIELLAAAFGELISDPKNDKGAIESFRLRAQKMRSQS